MDGFHEVDDGRKVRLADSLMKDADQHAEVLTEDLEGSSGQHTDVLSEEKETLKHWNITADDSCVNHVEKEEEK